MLKMADTVKVTNAYVQSGVSGGAAYLLRTLTACFLSILLIRSTSVGQPQFGWRDRGSARDSEKPLLYSLGSNRSTINHSISRRSYKSVEEIETQRMLTDGRQMFKKYGNMSGNFSTCCSIQHDPFDLAVTKYVSKSPGIDCAKTWPFTFNNSRPRPSFVGGSKYYLDPNYYCFRRVIRIDEFSVRKFKRCYRTNELKQTHPFQFVEVLAVPRYSFNFSKAIPVDVLEFPALKGAPISEQIGKPDLEAKLNVIVWSFSAMSRYHLYRTMPNVLHHLHSELKAVEYVRVSRIGDQFSNLIALLTGSRKRDIDECWPNRASSFDNCPVIWKRFSEQNYLTLYADDDPTGVFTSGKPGFNESPADCYYRPWAMQSSSAIFPCVGPETGAQKVLQFAKKFAQESVALGRKFFQFIWTHVPELNWPLEDVVENYLKSLAPTLNQTLLVFLSAQGFSYGPLRDTSMGSFEARNPFLFYVLPAWFSEKFPMAFENLAANRKKLTTLLDVHETLYDFLDMTSLSPGHLNSREKYLKESRARKKIESVFLPTRGVSHFLSTPVRKCAEAGISDHDCLCHRPQGGCVGVGPLTEKMGKFVVHNTNKILANFNAILKKCSYLRLRKVLCLTPVQRACIPHVGINGKKSQTELFRLKFTTTPGNGVFEATVSVNSDRLRMMGEIDRINELKNENNCTNDEEFRRFCVCSN